MKCVICGEREAVCDIRGFKVCADNFCKYDAWTFDPPKWWEEEMRGQWGGGNNSGNAADPRPHDDDEKSSGK